MDTFDAADGTRLAYHRIGAGSPLICVPGGPMRASAYLGDLGGLSAHHSLVLLDLRGTGGSAAPRDPATYRCDRLVEDVEALRAHLGLDRIDLLGHSAGAAVAVLYAVRHPDRISRLVLVNPSPRVVGLDVTDADRREAAELRRGEPWFPGAYAAFERIWAGAPAAADWAAITPFMYGRWDDAAPPRPPGKRTSATTPRRPPTTPAPTWARSAPACGPACCSSRASTTSRCRRSAPPTTRACSRTPRSPSSLAAGTPRGSTTPRGWRRRSRPSCAEPRVLG
ncbi:alpha/beta hydrolase [Dactylosporangium sp. NBC_01737]|uniref:alpha/beta fold hydrolase n=1 Tax=Dactylosporangium sp. NBC_01737 TaxID=2975959 RepID=UPI002E13981A|nr:alpha/beta hydrolase [Dactylosporangium sp. NBC_01737]